jgi:hypothetical protein
LWPFGVALAGGGVKSPHGALAEDCCAERLRKRHPRRVSDGDQEDERKRSTADVSRARTDIKTGVAKQSRDESGECPCYWPGGVRHAGGVSLVCGFCVERGKARGDTAPMMVVGVGRERECAEQQKLRGIEYRCGRAGGPVRSSDEAPVIGVERRDRLIWLLFTEQPGRSGLWEETSGQGKY